MNLSTFLLRARRRTIGLNLPQFYPYHNLFFGKTGIEIGGPSVIFEARDLLPVYALATRVDGVNFSTRTVWEDVIIPGETYHYAPGKVGTQYIAEASDLVGVPDGAYDFLLSSHSLEHCANALKTVIEWKRVVKPQGTILIITPDKHKTFDHLRPITTFAHLLSDYEQNVDERDETHIEEFIRLHDMSRNPVPGGQEEFARRTRANYDNRCMHHHVFSEELLGEVLHFADIKPVWSYTHLRQHTIVMGQV